MKGVLPWIVVGVLAVLLAWSLNTESGEPVVIEKHTTDTLEIVKTDTVTIYKTEVKTKVSKVVDTTYITYRDTIFVPVPIREYQFMADRLLDLRVRGYAVEFISCDIYPETIYKTIETTVIEKQAKSALFVYGGFSTISEAFYPKVGVGLSLKNKWLISGDIGVFQKKPAYGFTVGYNVLK